MVKIILLFATAIASGSSALACNIQHSLVQPNGNTVHWYSGKCTTDEMFSRCGHAGVKRHEDYAFECSPEYKMSLYPPPRLETLDPSQLNVRMPSIEVGNEPKKKKGYLGEDSESSASVRNADTLFQEEKTKPSVNTDASRSSDNPVSEKLNQQSPASAEQNTSTKSASYSSQSETDYKYSELSDLNSSIASLENNSCGSALNEAQICCENPERCLGEALSGGSNANNSAALQALQMVSGAALNMPASSIGAVCGRMKTVANGFTVINAALSAKCHSKVQMCKRECDSIARQATDISSRARAIGYDPSLNTLKNEVLNKANRLKNAADMCSRLDNASLQKANQAIASAYAAKMSDMCQKQATNNASATDITKNDFTADCTSVANAANPICQNQCNRNGWENDPVCRAARGLSPTGTSISETTPTSQSNPSLLNSGKLDVNEDPQEMNEIKIDPKPSRVNAGQGNGGTGLGNLGGSGVGGSDRVSGSTDANGGYNTNVLSGTRTGSGYSSPMMRNNTGGSSYNYGSARTQSTSSGRPFNPRDYLPGGKLDPKRTRGLAGVSNPTLPAPAKGKNIFQIGSDAVYEMCMDGEMYYDSCEGLRKFGPQKVQFPVQ